MMGVKKIEQKADTVMNTGPSRTGAMLHIYGHSVYSPNWYCKISHVLALLPYQYP